MNYLSKIEENGRSQSADPHIQIVTRGWRRYVLDGETFDKRAYVFCCLDRVRSALRRRDLFIAPSVRYPDARLGLLSEKAWDVSRLTISRSLGHSLSAEQTLKKLGRQLDETYRSVARNLPTNPLARVEENDDKAELVVTAIDKAEEPQSLIQLRDAVNARLPRVDLPQVLLEIAGRTDFTSTFTHVSERESRMGDLATSLCACLIADACNIGPDPFQEIQYANAMAAKLAIADYLGHWWFEPISFKLAPGCWYRPDFIVIACGGELQVHETKASEKTTLKSGITKEIARIEDDAAVKLKVSARLYDCFQHFLVWKSKETGEWNLIPKN